MVAEILNDVLKYKIIAIIRGIPSSVIVSTVEAILKGGIRCIGSVKIIAQNYLQAPAE